MGLFPKCMVGKNAFITADGYVMPCCWLDVPRFQNEGKIRDFGGNWRPNIFRSDDFSLRNKSYEDIVTSDEWYNALFELYHQKYETCSSKCSNMIVDENNKIVLSESKVDELVHSDTLKNSFNFRLWKDSWVRTWDHSVVMLEFTTRCNLKCLYCPRYEGKTVNQDITIQMVEDVMFSKRWNIIEGVGNYGDFIFYPYFHEAMDIFSYSDSEQFLGHIAATGRTQAWWDETIRLWKRCIDKGQSIKICWGIDGLEDTSSLHRVNQNWDEITMAMRKSAEIGCQALWQYIPMSFNEHQIDEARELADKWGVKFYLHLSGRFKENDPNTPKDPSLYRKF